MRSLLLIFFSFLPFLFFFYLNTHIHLARRPVSGYLTFPCYCGEVEHSVFILSMATEPYEGFIRLKQQESPTAGRRAELLHHKQTPPTGYVRHTGIVFL